MESKKILEALKKLREQSKKRNFKQSVDFAIALRDYDLKNPDSKIDEYVILPVKTSKKIKVCAIVDKELTTSARKVCDKVITKEELAQYAGKKKEIKKLAREFDYFIAQATIMTNIAAVFGKFFGPRGKMPNPKLGCVVPPKANLENLVNRLRNTIRIQNKKQPVVSALVGDEGMSDEELAKNIIAVYDTIEKRLPRGSQQIRKTYVKFTMSKPVVIGA